MSGEQSKRPARRVRSAKARLTPPGPEKSDFDKARVVKEAQERAKSAKAIREKHLASVKVFPRPPSRNSKERFTTLYHSDFEGSFVPPAELRPTSPTRRNNPHPGKQFMVWRVPTREIGIPPDEGLELPPGFLGTESEFDAFEELGGSLDQLKLPPPRPTSTDYGAYLRHMPQARQPQKGYNPPIPEEVTRPTVLRPIKSDTIERTVQGANMEAMKEWLQTASPDEQHTILKMLKSAEEAQVKDTINEVMQPGAARAVKSWLTSADDKEREVAVRLFSSLGPRPGSRRQRSHSVPSRPPSRQPLPPPVAKLGLSSYHTGPEGEKLRTRRVSAPQEAKPWPAGIWHHKPIRDPPPKVYHGGSLFGQVRGPASHYNVHPEWPDYYSSSDVVH